MATGQCNQCGNTPMYEVPTEGGPNIPLCLNCYQKFVQVTNTQVAMLGRQVNFALAQMESIGFQGTLGRYTEPQNINVGMSGVTFNNIAVNNSAVGVINTGSLTSIDGAISVFNQQGDTELGTAVKQLTEAILTSTEVQEEDRKKVVDLLSAIATEARQPKESRRKFVVVPLMKEIGVVAGAVSGMKVIWGQLEPLLQKAFDIAAGG